jgi:TonB family protein
MKKITYLLILSFALLAGCSSSEIDYNLIQDRNGIAYLPNEPEPLTGTAVASYPSGQQQIVVSYENGKPTGISSEWYANGQMKTEQHFSGEDKGRIRDWYENGEVARDVRVLDGTLVGRNIWKSPEFEGEINALNGLLDGAYIYKTNTDSTTSNYSKGLHKQRKHLGDFKDVTSNTESHFEHRYEGTQSRLTFYKRRYEYKSEYSHNIEESELDYLQGQIVTKTFKKGKDDQEFKTESKKEKNEWEDTSPSKVSVEARKDRVLLESGQYIEPVSLKTGKVDGRSWGNNEKRVISNSYNQGILNGWDISFDREKAAWDDDPSCYISGDWEYEAEKCEVAFGKSKTPADSIIPQRFKVLIESDEKKVAEAAMREIRAKEAKKQAEEERKRKIEAEKARKAAAEKKRRADAVLKRIAKEKAEIKEISQGIGKNFCRTIVENNNVVSKESKDPLAFKTISKYQSVIEQMCASSACYENIVEARKIKAVEGTEAALQSLGVVERAPKLCDSPFEVFLLSNIERGWERSLQSNYEEPNFELAKLERISRDDDYIPLYVPQPQYPRRAQTRGKEGYAVVEITITTTGGVRDPILVEEYPEGWGFGRAGLKAAMKLKYKPRVTDGVGQEVPNVLYKFSFAMAK